MTIHPTAIVDSQADIHPEANIGPFCVIGADVTIEAGAELRNHATIYGRSTIGAGTIIYPGAVIGGDPQSLRFQGEDTDVQIGSNCVIHECVTVHKGTAGGGGSTVVGDDCMLMAYSHIAHDCRLEEGVIIGNNTQVAGHVTVGRKAIISGMTGVHHFVTIGELSFIAAMSGVKTDVPPYVMAEGYPSKVRNLNIVGLRRSGMEAETLENIRLAYKKLYRDGQPISVASDVMRESELFDVPEVRKLCDWVTQHINGAVKGRYQESRH